VSALDTLRQAARGLRFAFRRPVALPAPTEGRTVDSFDYCGLITAEPRILPMTGERDTEAQDHELSDVYGISEVTP